MNGDSNDDRPRSLDGIDPQAAADELRAILAASGEGEGIVAQLGSLAAGQKEAAGVPTPAST
jgi:hypothetical protein